MLKLFKLFLLAAALVSLIGIADLARGQDVYLLDFPEAREQIDYAMWSVNERAGLRAEYAGAASQVCQPGIVVREATQAEWEAANPQPHWQAFASTCPLVGAYQVAWRPGLQPTNSLMLHELGGHAMGCWKHHTLTGMEALFGLSRHVMAPLTAPWAALTAEDVDCILEGNFWPQYQEPDLCFIELTPEFDLIAPDALGYYTRLEFVGDVDAGRYEWRLDRRIAGDGECASVRVQGGQIHIDDVRSQWWQGSAIIAPQGSVWALVVATPSR